MSATVSKIRVFPTNKDKVWSKDTATRSAACNKLLGVNDCKATDGDFSVNVQADFWSGENYQDGNKTANYICKSQWCTAADPATDPAGIKTLPNYNPAVTKQCSNVKLEDGIDSFKVKVTGSDPNVSWDTSPVNLHLGDGPCWALMWNRPQSRQFNIPKNVPEINKYYFVNGDKNRMDNKVESAGVTSLPSLFPKPYATSNDFLAKCCTATAADAATYCPTDYKAKSPLCDEVMTKWCGTADAPTPNSTDPKCGCFIPKQPVSDDPKIKNLPQRCWASCTDTRAYATAGMGDCTVNANICDVIIKAGGDVDPNIKQDCDQQFGKNGKPTTNDNGNGEPKKGLPTWIWFAIGGGVLLLILIVIAVFLIPRSKKQAQALPTYPISATSPYASPYGYTQQ